MLTDVKEALARSLPFFTLSYQCNEWHDQRLSRPAHTVDQVNMTQHDGEYQTDNSLEVQLMG